MSYILITNLDDTGIDTLVCDTNLDSCDIWLKLTADGRKFDDVREIDKFPSPVPDNMNFSYFTPRGEYEIQREIASGTPELSTHFPSWEVLHPKKRARR